MHFNQDSQEPGDFVAIKKIVLGKKDDSDEEMDEDLQKSIQSEIKIFKKINKNLKKHANLVSIEGIYQTSHNVYVIMEYCPDGDL